MSGALRSEWIKLRSLRSTWLILGFTVALAMFVGVTGTSGDVSHWATMTPAERAAFDPVGDALAGFSFGSLALAALGVIVATSEYGSGLIRTTLTAVPGRVRVFTAKAIAVALLTFVIGQIFVFVCFGLGQVVLASSKHHLAVGLGHPGVLRALLCAGIYLVAVTLVGFGIGSLVRHTGAGIALAFGALFLAYPVAGAFQAWTRVPQQWLLSSIADRLATVTPQASPRFPGSTALALGELAVWVVVACGLGGWRMRQDP